MTTDKLKEIQQKKQSGEAEQITPNLLYLLEDKVDRTLWFKFKDALIWDYEAPYYYKVVQTTQIIENGKQTDLSTVHTYSISMWQDLTMSTAASKTKYGSMNPLAGKNVEVIHDPIKFQSSQKTKTKKEAEEEREDFELTFEMLESADLKTAKSYYKKAFGKASGPMSEEKVREKLVDYVNGNNE